MSIELRYDPDPILARVASPIVAVDDEIRAFAREMIELMRAEDGAGLAAPQGGRSLRMFVMENLVFVDGKPIFQDDPLIFVNPVYVSKTRETEELSEGCLSFPGRPVKKVRHIGVTVRATNLDGVSFTYVARGFTAQCIQHEMDHLDGVTIFPIEA